MALLTVAEALKSSRPATNPSRWYEAAYERLRLSFQTTDKGPEARAEYEARVAELRSGKEKRGHQSKLPADEVVHRVSSPSRTTSGWIVSVSGKKVWLGSDKQAAIAKWESLMIEHGHGLSPGRGFFWNALEQKWERGERSYRSLNYGRMKDRLEGFRSLLAEEARLKSELVDIHLKLDEECRVRRRECRERMRARWLEVESRLKKYVANWRATYRASLAIDEQATWDADRKRIRIRANRKRILRVEALQRISRPWKDKESGLWFAWVGADHRKLVRLGDDEAKARVVWWVLKGALNAGGKTLRRPEGILRSIEELLDVSPERVMATLRQLGWKVEMPSHATSARGFYRVV